MYFVYVIDYSIIQSTSIDNVLNEVIRYSSDFILLVRKQGRLLFSPKAVINMGDKNINVMFEDFTYEAEFINMGHYITLEIMKTKRNKKIVDQVFEVNGFMGLDSEMDNYLAGVGRMFSLPYFGNDLYLSTLLNQQLVQNINLEQNGVHVLPYMWFYYHNLDAKKAEVERFIKNHIDKEIVLIVDNISAFKNESFIIKDYEQLKVKTNELFALKNVSKFIIKAKARGGHHLHCVDGFVFEDVNQSVRQDLSDIFRNIFIALGQETTLFGARFYYINKTLYVDSLFNILEFLFDFKNEYKDVGKHNELFKVKLNLYKKLIESRQQIYFNILRRQFSFQSSILDSEEGGKL